MAGLPVLLLMLFSVFFLNSQWGLQWTFNKISSQLPESTTLRGVAGKLLGPIYIDAIQVDESAYQISMEKVELDPGVLALIRGVLHLERLHVEKIRIITSPVDRASEDAALAGVPANRGIDKLQNISLPVGLKLDQVLIDNLNMRSPGETAVVLKQVALAAESTKQTLRIHKLALTADEWRANVSGTVELEKNLHHDVSITWSTLEEHSYNLTANASIKGDMNHSSVEAGLSGMAEAKFTGVVKDVINNASWKAAVNIVNVDFSAFGIEEKISQLNGELHSSGNIDNFSVAGVLNKMIPGVGTLKTELNLDKTLSNLALNTIKIHSTAGDDEPVLLAISGGITLDPENTLEFNKDSVKHVALNATWKNLGWPVNTGKTIKSTAGELVLNGELERLHYTLRGQLQGKHVPHAVIDSTGTSSLHGMQIARFEAAILDGKLSGKGEYSWLPEQRWRLDLTAKGVNPGMKWKKYPGKFDVDLLSAGNYQNGEYSNKLELTNLTGTFKGHTLTAIANVDLQPQTIKIKELLVKSASSEINIRGNYGAETDLRADISIEELGRFFPETTGKLKVNGKISGRKDKPQVKFKLHAGSIQYKTISAGKLVARIDADMSDAGPSTAEINMHDINTPGGHLDTVQLNIDGLVKEHKLGLYLVSDELNAELQVRSGIRGDVLEGSIINSYIQQNNLGRWVLNNRAKFTIEDKKIVMDAACWSKDQSGLCIASSVSEGNQSVLLELKDFQMAVLNAFFDEDIQLQGEVNGKAAMEIIESKDDEAIKFQAGLDFSPGVSRFVDNEGIEQAFPHKGGRLDVVLDKQGATGSLLWLVNEKGSIKIALTLPRWQPGETRTDQDVTGSIDLDIADISFLQNFVKNIGKTAGVARGKIKVGGSVNKPAITGQVKLENAYLDVPQLGIALQDVNVAAESKKGNIILISGKTKSGGGDLEVDGKIEIEQGGEELDQKNKALLKAEISLTGNNFEVVNLSEANVFVSPDIQLYIDDDRADIQGVIHIPRARINPKDVSGTVQASDDVVIVGQEVNNADKQNLKIYSSVRFEAGSDVRFTGYGIDAFLEGRVVAFADPDKETSGYGEIKIRKGKYTAYREELDLEAGKLDFRGNLLTNPNLSVRAVKKLQGITAGVNVTGTLASPVLTLFSEPAKKEEDILSYLILGVPANEASSEGGKALLYANVLKKLKERHELGLDEIRLDTSDTGEETSLVIGKYFTPRLYVNYSVVSGAVNVLMLRYKIGSKWLLQSETGENKSADFLYTYEH